MKREVLGKFHTVTFNAAQFFAAWVSFCMVKKKITHGEENLMNNEKF
jgi:hypothetical protein